MENNTTLIELKAQLQKAAILELTTIAPYLTAEFSIPNKEKVGRVYTSETANRLHDIFIEEMQHCAKVSKILYSIGGEVRFNKDTIPSYPFTAKFIGNSSFPEPYFGKRDLTINLESYNKDSLRTFLEIEKPDYLKKEEESAIASSKEDYEAYTIGEFYQLIEKNIDQLFEEDPNFTLRGQYKSKEEIIKDLHLIAEQGEGNIDRVDPNNHFYKFLELFNERKFAENDKLCEVPHKKDYPVSTGEPLNLEYSISILKNAKHDNYVNHKELSELNLQFNKTYTFLLKIMEEMYNEGENPKDSQSFFTIMVSLRQYGEAMMKKIYKKCECCGNNIYGAPSFEWHE